MLDPFFMNGVEKFFEDDHFIVWQFPADKGVAKQERPIILNYSIMTRAYGTHFNKDNFISCFNEYGFDVYLVDWGKTAIFTLQGWTLDTLADNLLDHVVDPLLSKYNTDKLNVFGICLGGFILSYLIDREQNKNVGSKFHRIAYYGVPILGARDLGMEKTFNHFYQAMKPYEMVLNQTGLSLFLLDAFILNAASRAMFNWSWEQFWEDGLATGAKMVTFTVDDRWVPFQAFMDIIEQGFTQKSDESFHIAGKTDKIHFFNLVGQDDMLVKPSASIVEWNSKIPERYLSFKQKIIDAGHFIFARPGFREIKKEIALWFAGLSFPSIMYKLDEKEDKDFLKEAETLLEEFIREGFDKANKEEREQMVTAIEETFSLGFKTIAKAEAGTLASTIMENRKEKDAISKISALSPVIEKSTHRV